MFTTWGVAKRAIMELLNATPVHVSACGLLRTIMEIEVRVKVPLLPRLLPVLTCLVSQQHVTGVHHYHMHTSGSKVC